MAKQKQTMIRISRLEKVLDILEQMANSSITTPEKAEGIRFAVEMIRREWETSEDQEKDQEKQE